MHCLAESQASADSAESSFDIKERATMRKIVTLLLVVSMSTCVIGCQDTKKQQDAAEAAKHAAEEAKVAAEKTADAIKEEGQKAVEATEHAAEEVKKAGADAVEAIKDAVPK
jgi:hypothetical protein